MQTTKSPVVSLTSIFRAVRRNTEIFRYNRHSSFDRSTTNSYGHIGIITPKFPCKAEGNHAVIDSIFKEFDRLTAKIVKHIVLVCFGNIEFWNTDSLTESSKRLLTRRSIAHSITDSQIDRTELPVLLDSRWVQEEVERATRPP